MIWRRVRLLNVKSNMKHPEAQEISLLTECQRRPETLPPPAGPGGWNSSCRMLLYEEMLRMSSSAKKTEDVRRLNNRETNKHLSTLALSLIRGDWHTQHKHFSVFFYRKNTRSHTALSTLHTSSHSFSALWFGVASSDQWDRRLNLPSPPPRPLPTWM